MSELHHVGIILLAKALSIETYKQGVGKTVYELAVERIKELEAKLEAMERAIEKAKREIGGIRCFEDERYAKNALIILTAAQEEQR